MATWLVFAENVDLAAAVQRSLQAVQIHAEVIVHARPLTAACDEMSRPVAAVCLKTPAEEEVSRLAAAAAETGRLPAAWAALGDSDDAMIMRLLSRELGLLATHEIEPLASCLALLDAAAERPWQVPTRSLSTVDLQRLQPWLEPSKNAPGCLASDKTRECLLWQHADTKVSLPLGTSTSVAMALHALRDVHRAKAARGSFVSSIDRAAVNPQTAVDDVLFGPRRELSDPASKTALAHYQVPVPAEELCSSPSEAARLGFPVRMTLASPDLRIWDHPELSVDGVDSAAAVREMYRQIMAFAAGRDAGARLLGVLISESKPAVAWLHVRLRPLPAERLRVEIGFADPHGLAAQDQTLLVMPTDVQHFEHALQRLRGFSLLLDADGRAGNVCHTLHAVCSRLAAFVHHHREQVDQLRIQPLAVLVGGEVEIREACISINDAFENRMRLQ